MADRLTRTLVVGGLLSSSGSSKAFLSCETETRSIWSGASTKQHNFSVAVCSYRGRREAVSREMRDLHKERRVSAQNVAGARRVSIGSIILRASLGSPGSRNLTEHEQ